jgi:hypothetical protein
MLCNYYSIWLYVVFEYTDVVPKLFVSNEIGDIYHYFSKNKIKRKRHG